MQLENKQSNSLKGIFKNVLDEPLKESAYIKLLFTNATSKVANTPLEKQGRVFNEASSNRHGRLCENTEKQKLLKTIKLPPLIYSLFISAKVEVMSMKI